MTELEFWTHVRAALIRQDKAIMEQHVALRQFIAAIERMYETSKKQEQSVIMPAMAESETG